MRYIILKIHDVQSVLEIQTLFFISSRHPLKKARLLLPFPGRHFYKYLLSALALAPSKKAWLVAPESHFKGFYRLQLARADFINFFNQLLLQLPLNRPWSRLQLSNAVYNTYLIYIMIYLMKIVLVQNQLCQ